jgi:hypothetical protein
MTLKGALSTHIIRDRPVDWELGFDRDSV